MSCQTKFEPGIKWDCIREVIAEIRGGSASLVTAKKLAWVVGCAIDQFDGEEATIQTVVETPSTVDGCCGRLDELANQSSVQAINPELIALLIKLLNLWLSRQ